jgi:hypothetical protein
MTLASSIITSVGYDLKLSTTDATARTNELINYMNRIIQNAIVPALARFKSDMGMKEWTTTESSVNNPKYSLPSDFRSFYALYGKTREHGGALASAASSSSLTLDSSASSSDDTYNGMIMRLTSGTYADTQRYITDYTGSSVTASTVAFAGTPGIADTFVIVEPFTAADELTQVEMDEYNLDYTTSAEEPEVYSLLTDTSVMIGPCPDSSTVVFYGLYFYAPAAMTAGTDTLPFNGIFDELIRTYTAQMGMLRDEYNVSVEETVRSRLEADIISIIRERSRRKPGGGQSRIRGSRD